jgi:hypothetical protein
MSEPEVTVQVCGPRWCEKVVQEHVWDGPVAELPGNAESVTCSRCGLAAMLHDLWMLH